MQSIRVSGPEKLTNQDLRAYIETLGHDIAERMCGDGYAPEDIADPSTGISTELARYVAIESFYSKVSSANFTYDISRAVIAVRRKGSDRCGHAPDTVAAQHEIVAQELRQKYEQLAVHGADTDSDIDPIWQPAIQKVAYLLCRVLIIKPTIVNERAAKAELDKAVSDEEFNAGQRQMINHRTDPFKPLMAAFPGSTLIEVLDVPG